MSPLSAVLVASVHRSVTKLKVSDMVVSNNEVRAIFLSPSVNCDMEDGWPLGSPTINYATVFGDMMNGDLSFLPYFG